MPSTATKPIPFSKLPTKAAKRRAICADAIAQLKRGALKAATGVFVGLPESAFETGEVLRGAIEDTPDLTVKQLLETYQVKTCQTCALGALMMGQFRINGDCKVASLAREQHGWNDAKLYPFKATNPEGDSDDKAFSPFVLRYFSAAQLQLIEVAFEGGRGAFDCSSEVLDWREHGNKGAFEDEAVRDGWLFTVEEASAAMAFRKRFPDDAKRLTAILRAIINHPKALFAP